jgi:hypothetical protein
MSRRKGLLLSYGLVGVVVALPVLVVGRVPTAAVFRPINHRGGREVWEINLLAEGEEKGT